MANVIRLKRASGSDPAASDLVSGEPAVRTDTGELFFKKDDGSVAKVSGAGGGPDFKYLALRNAANNGAASYPNADFTLVTSGTTTALTPTAANTLLVSVNGVIQKPNTGTSTPSSGFALSGSTIKFGANLSAAPDFILYQESGGIGEPSDETVSEAKLKVSNSPINGYFLSAQSGNTGGLTWAAPVATSCTGNSATATALATARAINGVNFDGTAAITVTAAAGTLTGTTLNSSVVTSSLTSLGDLAGLTVDGDATFTGANYNVLWDKSDNALEFADNAKAVFGTGGDLEIFHDGGGSIIKDVGTGDLRIGGDGDLLVMDAALSELKAKFSSNGAVELYYDNVKRLETASSRVVIRGASGLGVYGETGASNDGLIQIVPTGSAVYSRLNLYNAAGNQYASLFAHAGQSLFLDTADNGHINFRANGTGDHIFQTNGVERMRIDGTDIKLPDDQKINFGTGNDLQIYHDGTDNIFQSNGLKNFIFRPKDTDVGLKIIGDGGVELYHDNGKKFETTSTGTTVTGFLGINVASPDSPLEVGGTGPSLATIHHTDGGTNDEARIMLGALSSNPPDQRGAGISARNKGAGHDLEIQTSSTHSAGPSTKMTVTAGGNVQIANDSGRLQLGASQDLQIYHDGNDSYIDDAGVGSLLLRTTNNSTVAIKNSNDNMARFLAADAVELYHNGTKKLETTSTGVTFNGTGAILVPKGTTAQRPTGANGHVRYNETTNALEGYINGAWVNVKATGLAEDGNYSNNTQAIADDLWAYWDCDSTSTTRAGGDSGAATLYGVTSQGGKISNSWDRGGSATNGVLLTSMPTGNNFTLMFQLYRTDNAIHSSTDGAAIVHLDGALSGGSPTSVILGYDGSNGTDLRFGGNGWVNDGETVLGNFSNFNWYHMVITRTSGTTWKFYLDGSLITTRTETMSVGSSWMLANYSRVNGNNNTNAHYFRGRFDEIAVWDRTLSASEISAIYNAQDAGTALL